MSKYNWPPKPGEVVKDKLGMSYFCCPVCGAVSRSLNEPAGYIQCPICLVVTEVKA